MYEMTIQLRTDGGSCLYEQIYEHIKQEIRKGRLLAGERLPSVRFLAEYLQVSRCTVDYAYEQLLSEGYIEARPCKGHFVCPIEELFQIGDMETAGGGRTASAGSAVSSQGADAGAKGENYIDFSPFDIDMSGFPFGVWKKITKNILTYANSDLFSKGEVQGDYDLRLTISRYLHSSRGVNCRPEQMIVGAGNDYLLMLLEKILGPDMRIAMENPTYKRSFQIFRTFGYHISTVDMDDCGMRTEKLEREKGDIAYVMPSHQFPMGTVMPIGRRMELLRWADRKPGRYLIEDDYDSEFRYHGKPIPALQASDRHGRVIYMGTFSKAIAPAIRISFMVLPEPLLERFLRKCSFFSCTVSRIDQRVLNEFIREGYFERHLNKMRKIYGAKHEQLLESMQPLKEFFDISGENAGLHVLLTSKTGVEETELIQKAAKYHVRVYGLSQYMVKESLESKTVLAGFGGLSEAEIKEGMELLQRAWK